MKLKLKIILLASTALVFSNCGSAQQKPTEFLTTKTGAEHQICCGKKENRMRAIESCFQADGYSFSQKTTEINSDIYDTSQSQCLANFGETYGN